MENNFKIFSREEFDRVTQGLKLPPFYDADFVFEVYLLANEAISQLPDLNLNMPVPYVNPIELTYYVLGEFIYSCEGRSEEEIRRFKDNETIKESMASVSADKYLSLSMFNHREIKIANKFLPSISSLNLYLNFIQNALSMSEKNDPKTTLVRDLLNKSIGICRSILILLVEGYETQAFGAWRTLHECECTLVLLDKYGDSLIDKYLRHMNFGMAFRNSISDKEIQDKIFYQMKDEMRELGLKSKDIKKYIEYGWLYYIPEFKNDETAKLNFRDGLEKVAGLENYSKIYELSSEIIHSTPLLIYSNKNYFYYQTLLAVYESFFRLENVFVSLFKNRVTQQQLENYEALRNVYYSQLVNIHKKEMSKFKRITEKKV